MSEETIPSPFPEMYVVVIDNNDDAFKRAGIEAEAKGLRWACSSNTGLPHGKLRLTFLPASAFVTAPSQT